MLSFDITDRNIRIIKGTESGGKIRISSAATLDLEEEVIVNGHVRDVPRLATLINQVLRTNKMPDKEAIVSVSSNLTIFKELHIQKAEKQQDFMKMVRAEMANALGIDESYSVSYIVVGDSDMQEGFVKVLATACPFEIVDCYKRVFNMLQIALRSVMIGCNCITKVLLADVKVKSKMPLLAVQIDPNFISLNLYENNQLSFSRFASISSEDYDGSDDYVFEAVNENVFRMLQFQKSKIGSDPIENVVFYGDTREYVRLTNDLEKLGIRTSIITVPPQIHGYENLEFSVYANAIGAMFKRNKETERINLLETDTVNNNKIRSNSSYYALLLGSIAASLLICAGAWAFLAIQNKMVENDIQEIKDKKESQLCMDLKAQLTDLENKQKAMRTYLDGVNNAYEAYKSRPYPKSATFTDLEKTIHEVVCGEGSPFYDEIQKNEKLKDLKFGEENFDAEKFADYYEISSIQYSDGVYSVSMWMRGEKNVPFQTQPAKLIQTLRDLSYVENVPYNGYSVNENAGVISGSKPSTAAPADDDTPGSTPAVGANSSNSKYDKINMSLTITTKGDGVSLEED